MPQPASKAAAYGPRSAHFAAMSSGALYWSTFWSWSSNVGAKSSKSARTTAGEARSGAAAPSRVASASRKGRKVRR